MQESARKEVNASRKRQALSFLLELSGVQITYSVQSSVIRLGLGCLDLDGFTVYGTEIPLYQYFENLMCVEAIFTQLTRNGFKTANIRTCKNRKY